MRTRDSVCKPFSKIAETPRTPRTNIFLAFLASLRFFAFSATLNIMQLLGKTTTEIESILREMGEPNFRGRQIAAWIYRKGASSFDEMTDLPLKLRERLSSTRLLQFPEVAARFDSGDGSTKLLLQLEDGERIETVRLPYPDRVSVCVSSQAGCAMACQFCATGLGGFRRNLTTAEIIAQPLLAMTTDEKARNTPTHIVFMGMGEPLLNVNNVLQTLTLMHEEMQIPYRHITVSTVGIIAGIEKLAAAKIPVTLAVSLHAPDDELRHRLIPTSTKIRVLDLVHATREYVAQTGRRATFEYVVLGGVNDDANRARMLAQLCKGWPVHINLIPWNDVPGANLEEQDFIAPQPQQLREFRAILERSGVTVTQRVQRGADVAAACGQLRALKDSSSTRSSSQLIWIS